jgi:nucleoside-diphosphate-sugar epimerase
MTTRVLITGGAGFIGSHLVSRHVERGHQVHVVIRRGTVLPDSLRERNVVVHDFPLNDGEAFGRCLHLTQAEQIFHLAARTRWLPKADLSDAQGSVCDDLAIFLKLLSAASAADRPPRIFVRTGTLAEYGSSPTPRRETMREKPINAYTASMAAAAHYAEMLQSRLPFPVITARLALTYGPGQSEDFLIPQMIRNCLSGKATNIRNPDARRDLLYVGDAVDALCLIGQARGLKGGPINIATGRSPTMRRTAKAILRATGADPSLVTFEGAGPSDALMDMRASSALARKLIGWQAETALEDGIARTVAWYRGRIQPDREPRV